MSKYLQTHFAHKVRLSGHFCLILFDVGPQAVDVEQVHKLPKLLKLMDALEL